MPGTLTPLAFISLVIITCVVLLVVGMLVGAWIGRLATSADWNPVGPDDIATPNEGEQPTFEPVVQERASPYRPRDKPD